MTTAQLEVNSTPLITKHRPDSLDLVIGHKATVKSIEAQMKSPNRPHVYVIEGGSGFGKTTIARIMAKEFGCTSASIIEINAAVQNGVDDSRALVESADFAPMPPATAKAYIVDECHSLSKQAWQPFLKPTEHPAPSTYWFFLTTDGAKVDKAIKTRATSYTLQPVPKEEMLVYGNVIAEMEGINLPAGAMEIIAEASNGSPRMLLNLIGKCSVVSDLSEVRALMQQADDSDDSLLIALAREMVSGRPNMNNIKNILSEIKPPYSGTKHVLKAYIGKVSLGQFGTNIGYWSKLLYAVDQLPDYPSDKGGLFDLQLMIYRAFPQQ